MLLGITHIQLPTELWASFALITLHNFPFALLLLKCVFLGKDLGWERSDLVISTKVNKLLQIASHAVAATHKF